MFDPVHTGHLRAAQYARELLSLDLVKLVPCASPNHREPASASARHRQCMLEMLIATEPALQVDTQEIDRPGISYSVDTLDTLRQAKSAQQIVFILGADAFATLPRWHEWQRLFQLCHLLVLGRGSHGRAGPPIPEGVENRLVASPHALFATAAGNVYIARDFAVPVSSSEVRRRLAAGADVSDCLAPQVLQYIRENHLYQ